MGKSFRGTRASEICKLAGSISIRQLCVIMLEVAIDSMSTNVGIWMCCLSFAQKEKNDLALLLGAEFIPRATTTSNQKLSLGGNVADSVDYARHLSSGNTALPLKFPFAAGPSNTGGESTTQGYDSPLLAGCGEDVP